MDGKKHRWWGREETLARANRHKRDQHMSWKRATAGRCNGAIFLAENIADVRILRGRSGPSSSCTSDTNALNRPNFLRLSRRHMYEHRRKLTSWKIAGFKPYYRKLGAGIGDLSFSVSRKYQRMRSLSLFYSVFLSHFAYPSLCYSFSKIGFITIYQVPKHAIMVASFRARRFARSRVSSRVRCCTTGLEQFRSIRTVIASGCHSSPRCLFPFISKT